MQKRVPNAYQNDTVNGCVQCVLRGILEFFEPEKIWTWPEVDEFTGAIPGKWTWPQRTLINMAKRGYDAVWINSTILQDYVDMGAYKAMVKHLGQEAADIQRQYADMEQVNAGLLEYWDLLQQNKVQRIERIPMIDDIRRLLDEGYIISCSLNSAKLRGREGYFSHAVLVYDMDDEYVYFHESGPPVIAGDKAEINHFIAACTDPRPQQWSLYAYKKNNII